MAGCMRPATPAGAGANDGAAWGGGLTIGQWVCGVGRSLEMEILWLCYATHCQCATPLPVIGMICCIDSSN